MSYLLEQLDMEKSDRSKGLYLLYRWDQLDHSGQSERSEISDLPELLHYWKYYERFVLPKIDISILKKYQIPIRNDSFPMRLFTIIKDDSIRIDPFTFIKPTYLYNMEDAIRSVRSCPAVSERGYNFSALAHIGVFSSLTRLVAFFLILSVLSLRSHRSNSSRGWHRSLLRFGKSTFQKIYS